MEFTEGCMWEGSPWQIETEEQCSSYGGGQPCHHCHSVVLFPTGKKTWVCPVIVIAKNEGGCNSTGMCLQCILEGARTMGLMVDQAQAQAHSVTSSS